MHRVGPLSVLLAGLILLAVFLVPTVKMFSGYSLSGSQVSERWIDCGKALPIVFSGQFDDDIRGSRGQQQCLKAARGRLLEVAAFSLPLIAMGAIWLARARPTKPIAVLGHNPWTGRP